MALYLVRSKQQQPYIATQDRKAEKTRNRTKRSTEKKDYSRAQKLRKGRPSEKRVGGGRRYERVAQDWGYYKKVLNRGVIKKKKETREAREETL
jgi:hypothetical protein